MLGLKLKHVSKGAPGSLIPIKSLQLISRLGTHEYNLHQVLIFKWVAVTCLHDKVQN